MEKDTIAYLKEFYTVEQLAIELNTTEKYLREIIKTGELKAGKIANKYVIQREDIKNYLNK